MNIETESDGRVFNYELTEKKARTNLLRGAKRANNIVTTSKTGCGMEWNGIFLLGLSSSLLDGEHSLASQGTSLVRGMKVLGQNPGIQTSPC